MDRYEDNRIQAVYEAGCFGFWLYDRLIKHGVECLVTPPSLVLQEYGDWVKTDRRDGRKQKIRSLSVLQAFQVREKTYVIGLGS